MKKRYLEKISPFCTDVKKYETGKRKEMARVYVKHYQGSD